MKDGFHTLLILAAVTQLDISPFSKRENQDSKKLSNLPYFMPRRKNKAGIQTQDGHGPKPEWGPPFWVSTLFTIKYYECFFLCLEILYLWNPNVRNTSLCSHWLIAFLKLEYHCFPTLYYFLLHSEVTSHVHMRPLLGPFSHPALRHHGAQSWASCAVQQLPLASCLTHVVDIYPSALLTCPSPLPHCVHTPMLHARLFQG